MNYLNFKQDANNQIAYPASSVLSIFNTDATTLKVHLKPRKNAAAGDVKDIVTITCANGKTMDVAKSMASAVSSAPVLNGGIVEVLDVSVHATSLAFSPGI